MRFKLSKRAKTVCNLVPECLFNHNVFITAMTVIYVCWLFSTSQEMW